MQADSPPSLLLEKHAIEQAYNPIRKQPGPLRMAWVVRKANRHAHNQPPWKDVGLATQIVITMKALLKQPPLQNGSTKAKRNEMLSCSGVDQNPPPPLPPA